MNKLTLTSVSLNDRLESRPQVISVLSGKGGVGKSILSFNLAERLAAAGSRTLLIDADLHFGNLHILANVAVTAGLPQLLAGKLAFHDVKVSLADRWDLLPSPTGGSSIDDETSTLSRSAALIPAITDGISSYDFVIIDHASGASSFASAAAVNSDLSILVLVPELTSISDCYGLFKFLNQQNADIPARLLINRCRNSEEAEFVYSRFSALTERFLGKAAPYFGFVGEDEQLRKSLAAQIPLSRFSSQAIALPQLSALGRKLAQLSAAAGPNGRTIQSRTINNKPALADIKE